MASSNVRLAGRVRPEERDELTFAHVQRDPFQAPRPSGESSPNPERQHRFSFPQVDRISSRVVRYLFRFPLVSSAEITIAMRLQSHDDLMLCSTMTMVRPSFLIERISSITLAVSVGFIPVTGSSRNSRSGSGSKAIAISSILCSP